jgi:hypothetical protein
MAFWRRELVQTVILSVVVLVLCVMGGLHVCECDWSARSTLAAMERGDVA